MTSAPVQAVGSRRADQRAGRAVPARDDRRRDARRILPGRDRRGQASRSAAIEMRGAKRIYRSDVESILRVHLVLLILGGKDLSRITEEDVERYCAVSCARACSAKTVRNQLGVLHSLFALGQRRGWCVPTQSSSPKDRGSVATRHASASSQRSRGTLRTTYPDDPLGSIEPTLYLTAAMTGLRQNELFALRWRTSTGSRSASASSTAWSAASSTTPRARSRPGRVPMATRVAQALEQLHQRSQWRRRRRSSSRIVARQAARQLRCELRTAQGLGLRWRPARLLPRAAPHIRHPLRRRRRRHAHAAGVDGHKDPDTTAIYALSTSPPPARSASSTRRSRRRRPSSTRPSGLRRRRVVLGPATRALIVTRIRRALRRRRVRGRRSTPRRAAIAAVAPESPSATGRRACAYTQLAGTPNSAATSRASSRRSPDDSLVGGSGCRPSQDSGRVGSTSRPTVLSGAVRPMLRRPAPRARSWPRVMPMRHQVSGP